jgi:two-component system, chemotaxis family, CheB/CheR fusion protein
MPRSAIAAGCVDFVLPPHEIAREIARIAQHPYVQPETSRVEPLERSTLERIVQVLRQETGVDFAHYKTNTLHRRIARRIILHRLEGWPEYVQFLEGSPSEVAALHKDILLGVTKFFRDPDAFEALQTAVFPRLLEDRTRDDPLRIWVLGCSTGEEAYSLAMALTEGLDPAGHPTAIQVFATDLSAPAIASARAGVYTKSAAQDVSPGRLQRFFLEVDGSYRVAKSIRDLCVFARHNVLVDPPFSRVDLISCRNLLIYLEPAVQQRMVAILHYALKPRGFLWLGAAETIGSHRDLFEVENAAHRIFTKRPGTRLHAVHRPLRLAKTGPASAVERLDRPGTVSAVDVRKEAERLLVGRFAPPGVLVSADMEILQVWGDTGPYLAPAPGKASLNLLKMLREGLLVSVRDLVVRARTAGRTTRVEGLRVTSNGTSRDVSVEVVPLGGSSAHDSAFLVLFEDASGTRPAPSFSTAELEPKETGPGTLVSEGLEDEVSGLTRELNATREYLQAVIEQQEAANEELQASHEEAQSTNEELQSINEELETSKEEIQSSNEEMTTVNDELNYRNLELGRTNNDLTNLLASIQMAIIILGRDLRIRRFTSTSEEMFNLIPADLGRRVRDIRLGSSLLDLEALVAESIDTLSVVEREVQDGQGRWHLLRIRPYKTLENQIDGAVMVVVDIDALKRMHEYTDAIVATVRAPLLVLDRNLQVRMASAAFYDMFDVARTATEGRILFELGSGQWNVPLLRQLLEEVLTRDQQINDFEVDIALEGGVRKSLLLNARRLVATSSSAPSILLGIEDVTARRTLEAAADQRIAELAAADRAKDEFLAMLGHELRNPLGALGNALQLTRHPAADAATTVRAWDVMNRQVQSLTRLVDDLLDVARLAQGRIDVHKEVIDLGLVVGRAVESIEPAVVARAQ